MKKNKDFTIEDVQKVTDSMSARQYKLLQKFLGEGVKNMMKEELEQARKLIVKTFFAIEALKEKE